MSGRVLRSACTAALATTTVLAAIPFAAHAAAKPRDDTAPSASASAGPGTGESGPGRPGSGKSGATKNGPGKAFGPVTRPGTVAEMLSQLQRLYRQAEEATEAYNATEAELLRLRTESEKLSARLAKARTALARSRGDVGRLARQQYQGQSDLSRYLRLLLAHNPQQAMDERHLLDRAARGRTATVARLTDSEKRADALASASRKSLDKQQGLAEKQKKQRDAVRDRLQQVERLLASLSSEQIAAVTRLEKAGAEKAQRELVTSGALGGAAEKADGLTAGQSTLAPSAVGNTALRYAAAQIGKPYEWGAEGPDSFDCSGLTSQAWARAGVAIPRTSQEQWRELPRVSLDELRPGDLVIYFPKATHVAIYLGDGMVIQAPRPGAHVKVSPLAANPLLGAVRPDPGWASMAPAVYEPPKLPEGALDGSDTGYAQEAGPGGRRD
ncbi:NlpC/P60 family protein [Streptomyces sp. AK02-01A]|uniref:C40 family peptidase n=1 Tax=Streptomyces sp. AK02-01A TaxID=3028648 RepID=UPI0029AAB200|nr:NlpC/P60 family protein [Streptomyces sp. AK02-01A]MDX3852126.1 NlpC/P60 family protein [Streptomyces sp. AK02-01A]